MTATATLARTAETLTGTRVLIGMDHALTRAGIAAAVTAAGAQVAGWFVTAAEGQATIARTRPDVVLVDHVLPDASGAAILARLRAANAGARIVVITAEIKPELVTEALAAGADGVISKASDERELVRCLAAAAAGQVGLDASAAAAVGASLRTPAQAILPGQKSRVGAPLSPREAEIIALVAQGMSNPQIGSELYISAQTVKTHLSKAFTKLGTSDRAAAVYRAVQTGVLPA